MKKVGSYCENEKKSGWPGQGGGGGGGGGRADVNEELKLL